MSHIRTLLFGCLIVLFGLGITDVGLTEAQAKTPKPFKSRIMTFNIRFDFPQDRRRGNGWDDRKELVARVIKEMKAPIVCLQEDKGPQIADLKTLLKGYTFIGRGRHGGRSGEACSIAYSKKKMKLVDSGDFWLSDTPDKPGSNTWGDEYPHKVTWGLFQAKKTKNKFLVLNTHLDWRNGRSRIKGSQLIRKWLSERRGKLPVIVTGDFNTAQRSEAHKHLTGTNGPGKPLDDVWDLAKPNDPRPGTFHPFNGVSHTKRIDWILVGGPIKVKAADKIEFHENGRYPSDHFPVIADLLIY